MKILVCAHEAPLEPFDGFRGPVASLVEGLRATHDVRVLAVRAPDQRSGEPNGMTLVDRRAGVGARAVGAAVAMARGRPRGTDGLTATLAAPLRDAIAGYRPDVVHLTSGRLGGLASEVAAVPTVLAAFDALHLNAEAAAGLASPIRARMLHGEARRWARFEAATWPAFDAVTVVSDEDANALRAIAPSIPVRVIPAGVDAARFARDPAVARVPGRIVFHGTMRYPPNVAAAVHLARTVFPMIRAERPDATLVIAGRDPGRAVTALEHVPGVTVTGAIPDIRAVLSAASISIAAMRSGTGVKNKLLEAGANSLACVVTPLATRGLAKRVVDAMFVGRDDRALATLALRLLADQATADASGAALRDAVVAEHDWSAVIRGYEALYRRVVSGRLVAAKGTA